MRRRRYADEGVDPFTDLLFNALLLFTFLFMFALLFLNPPAKSGNVNLKAEYIITVRWADHSPDDIDTWVQNPEGEVLWFRNTETGFMHLDRDDRGLSNDTININGEEIVSPINQEIVTVRKPVRGEYIVNLHYYKSETKEPVVATVSVSKVNPKLEIAFYGEVRLPAPGAERTVVRFHIDADGHVGRLSTLPKSIVKVEAG